MGPIPWWKPAPGVGDGCSELVHEEDLSLFLLQGMLGLQQPWQEGEARSGQGGVWNLTQSSATCGDGPEHCS